MTTIDTTTEKTVDSETMINLNNAIAFVMVLPGCKAEVTGMWVWVHGNTKPVKEDLKINGFKWAAKKKLWYFAAVPSNGRRGGKDMGYIRTKYGSVKIGSDD